jgi:hypothetical protein
MRKGEEDSKKSVNKIMKREEEEKKEGKKHNPRRSFSIPDSIGR